MWEIINILACPGHSRAALYPVSGIIVCAALHGDGDVDMFVNKTFQGVLFCYRL